MYTAGGKTWKSHTFLNSGTFNITSGSTELEVLIVAGGGGGGADNAGGGGAGGLLYYGTETPKTPNGGALTKSVGSYSVVVGNGGNALSYAIRTGSSTNYAGGGNGGNENSQYNNNTTNPSGIGGITNSSGVIITYL